MVTPHPKLYSVPGQGVKMRPHKTFNGIGQREEDSIDPSVESELDQSITEPTPTPLPKRRRKGDEDEQ